MSIASRLLVAAAVAAIAVAAQAGPVIGQGTWESTLKARDINGNAVALDAASAAFFYDTTLDVTWLRNMNVNGPMNWGSAVAWADALTTGGFTDWRLPTIIDSGAPGCNLSYAGGTDCGYNVETQVGMAYSEWAHLYYVTLGNLAYCPPGDATCAGGPQTGWGLTNTAYFDNMQSLVYWSGTEYAPGTSGAWGFFTYDGFQDGSGKNFGLYAVAVRPGDVLAAAPEPQGYVLVLTALGALLWVRRKASSSRL